MSDKSYQEIDFHKDLVESELSFEEKVISAFRQIIPIDNKIEVSEFAVRLYKCTYCQPIQRVIIDQHQSLEQLQQGKKTAFILPLRIDILVL